MLKERHIANPFARGLVEWLLACVLAFLLFFVMRHFIFRLAHVTGTSMEPTFSHNDMVLLSRLSYRLGDPRAGDVIAFPFKEDPSEHYIKRVVGVPGDVISLSGFKFTINGAVLDDAFSQEDVVSAGDTVFPFTVPEGRYFVLGDNRNYSKDSRFTSVGCIPKADMVGKVVAYVWPLRKLGGVNR